MKYRCLQNQKFQKNEYSIVPIRFEDRIEIMNWRNEQIFHLRQSKPLTEADQNHYFQNVVAILFEQKNPAQILFSYLDKEMCVGYGGLVHINWIDKNAEISFVMNTTLEKEHFLFHWQTYLTLLEKVAFEALGFHKIYTYAYDLRPHLYDVLEDAGFKREAVLKEHCLFAEKFVDVVIHSKLNTELKVRFANTQDLRMIYDWANDPDVRQNAINSEYIEFKQHEKWFFSKITSGISKIFVLENAGVPIGQIRYDLQTDQSWKIDYSIDKKFRGKGFGKQILELTLFRIKGTKTAEVREENWASKSVFEHLNFENNGTILINGLRLIQFKKDEK